MGIFSWLFRKRKKNEFSAVKMQAFHTAPTFDSAELQRKALAEMEHRVYQTKGYIETWRRQYAKKAQDSTVNKYTFTAWTKLFIRNVAMPYLRCMEFIERYANQAFVQTDSGLTMLYDTFAKHRHDKWQGMLFTLKKMDRIEHFPRWQKTIEGMMLESWDDLERIHKDLEDKVNVLKRREKQLRKLPKAA